MSTAYQPVMLEIMDKNLIKKTCQSSKN